MALAPRARVVAVGLASALLLSGRPDGGPDLAEHRPTGAVFDAAAAAAELAESNPSLSQAELRRIGAAIARYSAKYDLDPLLVTAVIQEESGARPWVRSPKGAVGLMQVMPHMFEPMQMAGNLTTIESNIEAGCAILADNIRRLGEERGILAYFWGSDIRGDAYLHRVQRTRAALRRPAES